MYAIKQSTTTWKLLFMMIDSTDHISPKTGLTPTVVISKNGASFGSPAGAVSELANGWYIVAGNATDSNTLGPLLLHATASGADPSDVCYEVVAYNPQAGAWALVSDLATDYQQRGVAVTLPTGVLYIKKNTALNAFMFLMTDSTTHAPKTGVTVTATRSLDGGAFAACANAVTEVSGGWYKIDLANTDLNATVVALRFTGTASDDKNIGIITQA